MWRLEGAELRRFLIEEKMWIRFPRLMWERYFREMEASGYEHLIDEFDYVLYNGEIGIARGGRSIPSAITHSQEIEQWDGWFDSEIRGYLRRYKGHYDGSGPYEFNPPYKSTVSAFVKGFAEIVREEFPRVHGGRYIRYGADIAEIGWWFEPSWWFAKRVLMGNGSHVHSVPREGVICEHYRICDKVKIYAHVWNTLKTLNILLMPFWAYDHHYFFRSSMVHRLYTGDRLMHIELWCEKSRYPWYFRDDSPKLRRILEARPEREYAPLTPNPVAENVMSLENRMVDSHPYFAGAGMAIARNVLSYTLERGKSVMFDPKRWAELKGYSNSDTFTSKDMFTRMYGGIYYRMFKITKCNQWNTNFDRVTASNLGYFMEGAGPIVFREGHGFPGIDRLEFRNWWDFWEEFMKTHFAKSSRMIRDGVKLIREGINPFFADRWIWHRMWGDNAPAWELNYKRYNDFPQHPGGEWESRRCWR